MSERGIVNDRRRDVTERKIALLYALVAGQPFLVAHLTTDVAIALGYGSRESLQAGMKRLANSRCFFQREGASRNLHRNHFARRALRFVWIEEFAAQQQDRIASVALALRDRLSPRWLAQAQALPSVCAMIELEGSKRYRLVRENLSLPHVEQEVFLEMCEETQLLIQLGSENNPVWQLNMMLHQQLLQALGSMMTEDDLVAQLRTIQRRIDEIGKPDAIGVKSKTAELRQEFQMLTNRLHQLRLQNAVPAFRDLARQVGMSPCELAAALVDMFPPQ